MTASLLTATTSTGIVPSCQSAAAYDVWYSIVVPSSGNVTIETQVAAVNSMTNTVLVAFSGTCGSLTQINCDDDGGLPGSNDLMSKLNLTGQTPGTTLYIGVWKSNTTPPNGSNDQFKISAYDASLTADSFENSNFNYYPNPVKNILNLDNNQKITQVSIFNFLGQEVLAKSLNSTNANLDLSNLVKGVYLVKVLANQQIKTFKVIKE